jgi:hypothetical protein
MATSRDSASVPAKWDADAVKAELTAATLAARLQERMGRRIRHRGIFAATKPLEWAAFLPIERFPHEGRRFFRGNRNIPAGRSGAVALHRGRILSPRLARSVSAPMRTVQSQAMIEGTTVQLGEEPGQQSADNARAKHAILRARTSAPALAMRILTPAIRGQTNERDRQSR